MKIVPEMWLYSELAYIEPNLKEVKQLGNVDYFDSKQTCDDFCYYVVKGNRVIIAFRGTDGDFEAWVTNFLAMPSGDKMIHKGFYDAWCLFKNFIDKVVSKYPGKQYTYLIGGHSRGGSIATICARHIAKNHGIQCSCITFGAPSQGKKKYRDQLNMLPINLLNVKNGWDIVTYVPPKSLGYKHGGRWLKLKQPWYWFFTRRIRAHLQKSYRKSIEVRFGKDCYNVY